MGAARVKNKYIKSPLNYIGGKTKILKHILPLFPENIDNFVDLFAGGCNVGINVNANKVHFVDNLTYLIEMFKELKENELQITLDYIEKRIFDLELTQQNTEGYLKLREEYNISKQPIDLFVLIAFSFNHQIRFNNKHEFNNPFGKDRSSYNNVMKQNLINFIEKLKQINAKFYNISFEDFNFSSLKSNDFVYCDPPYLITTGTYNDGKRGFKGWSENEELMLLSKLDLLNKQNIKFGLSNVIEHKGKSNVLLKDWLEKNNNYKINYIDFNYSNSNYQTLDRDKNSSIEVLITNY
jgi:DNA adenine methylase